MQLYINDSLVKSLGPGLRAAVGCISLHRQLTKVFKKLVCQDCSQQIVLLHANLHIIAKVQLKPLHGLDSLWMTLNKEVIEGETHSALQKRVAMRLQPALVMTIHGYTSSGYSENAQGGGCCCRKGSARQTGQPCGQSWQLSQDDASTRSCITLTSCW